METARAVSAADQDLQTLRAQVLALSEAERASRTQLDALQAQLLALSKREAAARSQLKEAHSVTRALQEKARIEAAEAEARLQESLASERAARAKAEADLQRASGELRQQRARPESELETLRALFSDLMRGEAQGRQRLERLQAQVAEHERIARDLSAQLEEARKGAPVVVEQQAPAVAELQAQNESLLRDLAAERGRAKAHAERAAAEVEWAQDRARSATQAEEQAKDRIEASGRELSGLREELAQAQEARDRTSGQLAAQVAAVRKELEDDRAAARAALEKRADELRAAREELARNEAELKAARDLSAQLTQKIREQGELAAVRRDDVADERLAGQKMAVRIAELERQVADSVAARATEAEARALRVELEKLERERSAETMRRQAMEDERDRLAADHHAVAAQAKVDRGRAAAEIAALSQELTRAQQAADEARRAQAGLREQMEELERRAQRIEDERDAAVRSGGDTAAKAAEAERLRAQMELEAARQSAARAREETREIAAKAQRAAGEVVAKSQREIETARADAQAAQQELSALRSELASARAENLELSLRHDAAEKRAGDLAPKALAFTPRRMAAVALETGRYEEAERLLVEELAHAPDDAALHLQLGRLHYARNSGAAAEAELTRAMALDPRDYRAPLLLGLVQARRGLRRQSRDALREALRRNPACAEARDGLLLSRARLLWRGALAAAAVVVALAAALLLR